MNELYHHGVKGMRWGVRRRNYVPKGIRSRYSTVKSKYDSLSKRKKRALKVGTAIAVTGIAVYGIKKKRELDRKTIEAGINYYRTWDHDLAAQAARMEYESGTSRRKIIKAMVNDTGYKPKDLRYYYSN